MTDEKRGQFKEVTGLIVSAVAAVGTVWGISGSVLSEIVPPVVDAVSLARMVTFCAVGILMVLCVFIRPDIQKRLQYAWALLTAVLVAIALVAFLHYRSQIREYVYIDPPSAEPSQQHRYIRGDYHEKGQKIAQGLSTEDAVKQAGGREAVERNNELWNNESKNKVTAYLECYYVFLTTLLTIAIFIGALTLWRAAVLRT